ncbi:MAG TPA: hypothetical protein VGJ28_13115 [Micromonosporaceae bacterium]|jgi:hypothetical protein
MDETILRSERGVPRANYDQKKWIPAVPVFPAEFTRDQWAFEYGREFSKIPGKRRQDKKAAARLASVLTELHHEIYTTLPAQLAFIHMPAPRINPLPLCLSTWQAGGDRTERLRALTMADAPDAQQPPIVEAFSTERLGNGLRVQVRADGVLMLYYAFRVDELETDMRIFAGVPDQQRMDLMLPDADELVRNSWVARTG